MLFVIETASHKNYTRMDWIVKTLQNSPELALFLTLALGFALGQVKIKGFGLGTVTSVLLVGVVVGQLDIAISPTVKSTFFLLFLFAVGYSVGPQFIHSLKKEGIPQILFACVVCVACLLTAWAAGKIAGFDIGNTAGLLSGACTISAVLGVATDTINQLPIDAAAKSTMINEMPVAYAVTYIFGTAGTAWFLSSVGPKILGGNLEQLSKQYEAEHGGMGEDNDPSLEYAYDGTTFRAFRAECGFFDNPKSIDETERRLAEKGWPVYIERLRTAKGEIIPDPAADQKIGKSDVIVLNGPLDTILADENIIGPEVADTELLGFRVEKLRVIVSNKHAAGKTLKALRTMKERHGVVIRKIHRGNAELPLLPKLKLTRGDVVEIEGRKTDVDRFAEWLGYPERPTTVTDLLYVCLGIFIGGIIGSLTVHAGNIPLSLSASGGVLILGIIFGWLRSVRPTFGAVPEASIWLMNNLGLNAFIAIVGITAGPDFIAGLKADGISLFIAGVAVSIVPMFVGLMAGKYLFRFHPAITLGACSGSRTTTAALGAIEEAIHSKVPALSYTTTYAVGNTLLIIWGVVIVLMMS